MPFSGRNFVINNRYMNAYSNRVYIEVINQVSNIEIIAVDKVNLRVNVSDLGLFAFISRDTTFLSAETSIIYINVIVPQHGHIVLA